MNLIRLAPHEGEEAPLVLRLRQRSGWPDAHVPDDVLEWWWCPLIVNEGPAPLPARDFRHVAGVLADLALRDPAATARS